MIIIIIIIIINIIIIIISSSQQQRHRRRPRLAIDRRAVRAPPATSCGVDKPLNSCWSGSALYA